MKTILVDDELWMLEQFAEECAELPEIEIVGNFTFAEDALEYAKNNLVEFALLDIEMPGMNGVELAKELRKLYPEVIIVFVTGHKEYLGDFIDMKADYYVLKPYGKEEVRDVLQRAKLYSARLKKRVRIQTFGKFEVFVDGVPMHFKHAKAKELLALIVDYAGATVSSQEALDSIWEGKAYDKNTASVYRMTVSRLKEALDEAGIGDIIGTQSNQGRYLVKSKVDCDMLDFLNGDAEALKSFNGEYMSGYSWAEPSLGNLLRIQQGKLYAESMEE